MSNGSAARYAAEDLTGFAQRLFAAAGCDADKARTVAEVLVEGDLLGHTTHGLQLAAGYLEEIANGTMAATGKPVTVADRGAVATWDGRRLPGVWLTVKALDLAAARATTYGIGAVAIRSSHHIACLAAYLERATRHGLMVMIASSDPSDASVAPYGGTRAVFTPDPIAIGIPSEGEPILIDISASITTNGLTNRLRNEGKRYPGPWAQDAEGHATDDPNALFTEPPGTLLPTGGQDHGHKGYALALTVEALTQGLAGLGRADAPAGWGAGVFVQVWDPAAFAGFGPFAREVGWIARACRETPPAPGIDAVRLPGQRGLARKRDALANGVSLYDGIMPALAPWAEKLGVALPAPCGRP
jgi:LDH2 family malate/lactate/ureidoglycolate dehydrogenase